MQDTKTINLNFDVIKPFGNLLRKRCVLVAVEDSEGNILLGAKPSFYPPNIVRLLGGGVENDEDSLFAAARELNEELGVQMNTSDFVPLMNFVCEAKDQQGRYYSNQTMVYYTNIGASSYEPGDDVEYVVKMTTGQLADLGKAYDNLPESLWCRLDEGEFRWADYAKLYGPLHTTVAKAVVDLKKH